VNRAESEFSGKMAFLIVVRLLAVSFAGVSSLLLLFCSSSVGGAAAGMAIL
jgi:hypothetical protein